MSEFWAAGDAELARRREAFAHFEAATYRPLNAEWERLADQSHYRSEVERARLRPRLAEAEAEREQHLRAMALQEQRVALVNALLPQYGTERGALSAIAADVLATDRIDRDQLRALETRGRTLDYLRRVLFDATGDERFARPWQPLGAIKAQWDAQHVQRERVFTHILAAGYPRPAENAPWLDTAARLAALKPEKEQAFA